MKKAIVLALVSTFGFGCGGSKPMTRNEIRECLIDCAVARAACTYGQDYCDEKRRDCEKECR